MCRFIHYRFCTKVANSARVPPPDEHVKCETHHILMARGRAGDRRAYAELQAHDRVTSRDPEIRKIHYGEVPQDGKDLCIVDPDRPIVDHRRGGPPIRSMYYKRCDASWRNIYGEEIKLRAPGEKRVR